MKISAKSNSWHRWLFAALVAGFLWVLISRVAEIQQLLGTLAQGEWSWIALATGLQMVYFVGYAALFRSAFSLVDIPSRILDLLPITFASIFVNATAPSVGTAGLALFVDDVRRRGHSAAAATVSMLLVQGAYFGVFLLILSLGLLLLFRHHNLTVLEILCALVVFILVGGLVFVLALGSLRPGWLYWLFAKVAVVVNGTGRLVKRPFILQEGWAAKNAGEFVHAAEAIRAHPARLGITLLIALSMHLINLAALFCLFLAFHQKPMVVALVAGYSMTFLFTLVSPTPSGIGVVEVLVPLVYTSMGVPAAAGTAITLSYRGLSFWLPMLIGFVLLRQLRMFSSSERALAESGQVRLIAILTAFMGVLNVLSVFQPALLARLAAITQYAPVAIGKGGTITALLTGFALLILAYGLWRHKRMAWLLTVLVLVLSVVNHLLKHNYTEAVLATLLLAYLIGQRSHFHALSDEPSIWQGVQILAAAFGFTLLYGTMGFYLLSQASGTTFRLAEAWQTTLRFFTFSEEPGLFHLNTPFDYLTASIYIVGVVTFGYALLMLLRPVLVRAPANELERQRVQFIIDQYGRSALGQFILLSGKSFFFSTGGSVVAFTLNRRTAIALGDPIGPSTDTAAAIEQFLAYCQHRDWRGAFYRARDEDLSLYHEAGLQSIHIGQEAVIDLDAYTPLEEERAQVWQTAVHFPTHSRELVERLRLVSDAWLSDQHQEENRFAHGWFSRSYINQGVLITLSIPGQDILAFVHAVPVKGEQELAVSLIRYREFLPIPAHKLLLETLVCWAQNQGYSYLNLGLQPLLEHQQDESLSRERVAQVIYKAVEQPLFKIETRDLARIYPLLTSPRYLIYPSSTSLPAVWSALIRAGGSGMWSQIKLFAFPRASQDSL